jgi:lipopolysaccharide/colanic/teichoic acid biosynthesis glycosyltransferase
MMKRAFDLVFSAAVVLAVLPLMAVICVAIKLDSRGPILYRGVRIGKGGRPFQLSKFRTMVVDASDLSHVVTTPTDDPRITRVGRVLRHYNFDELPQFFDVLRGCMSVVGPRPEVPQYVAQFTEEQRAILSIRPGITDWASLWIGDKGIRVQGHEDPEVTYVRDIRPEKIRLQLHYVRTRSFSQDMIIVAKTFHSHILRRLFMRPAASPPPSTPPPLETPQ